MNKVQYFLIPVDDMPRAVTFYQDHFGWDITPSERLTTEDYHSIRTFPAEESEQKHVVYGGLFKRGQRNLNGITVVIQVASIDECLAKIKKEGNEIVFPKTPIKAAGFCAQIKDSEGNVIGLWEEAPNV